MAGKVESSARQVLFVQGGGRDTHDSWDDKLVASLKRGLGADYPIRYPRMPNESEPDVTAWKKTIAGELGALGDGVFVVGHSIGGAILIDYLADSAEKRQLGGVFLVASPYIGDGGWPSEELRPTRQAAAATGRYRPTIYFYQGRDDETVPFSHIGMFAAAFPDATIRRLHGRNHQLNDDLSEVADDIRAVARATTDSTGGPTSAR